MSKTWHSPNSRRQESLARALLLGRGLVGGQSATERILRQKFWLEPGFRRTEAAVHLLPSVARSPA